MSDQSSELLDSSLRQAVVPDSAAGRRFDAVLAELFPEFSRSRLSEWIKSGDALLDGETARPRDTLRGGETVQVQVVLETQTHAAPQDIPLNVLYEDDQVLVIDKPAGLVVHPGAGNPDGTLVNALLFRDPNLAAVPRAGVVHRLDKDTSGVMVVARTLQARRDPVPDSLMQIMDHQLRALPGPSGSSCEPARQRARLQTLQLLATDLEPVFGDLGEDRRFGEHAQALRAAIAAPLHAPNLDCAVLAQARTQISEACEACHRDFR